MNLQFTSRNIFVDFFFQKLERRKQVLGLYSLRLLLAPVLKHFILLDRYLSLKRSGFDTWIVHIFDPRLSLRNHVLLAMKK